MKKNIGTTDKIFRFILGSALIIGGYYYQSWYGLLGLILLFTTSFSFCGLYALFGINTCSKR
jgi:hypothetical protein